VGGEDWRLRIGQGDDKVRADHACIGESVGAQMVGQSAGGRADRVDFVDGTRSDSNARRQSAQHTQRRVQFRDCVVRAVQRTAALPAYQQS